MIGPLEVKRATNFIEIPRLRGGEVWFRSCDVKNTGLDDLTIPVGAASCEAYVDLAPGEVVSIRPFGECPLCKGNHSGACVPVATGA